MYYLHQKKDYKLRLNIKAQELNYLKFKALARNKIVPLPVRERAIDALRSEPAARQPGAFRTAATRVHNLCTYTGRARGLVGLGKTRSAGVSRLVFKNLADAGLIAGVRRAS